VPSFRSEFDEELCKGAKSSIARKVGTFWIGNTPQNTLNVQTLSKETQKKTS